MENSKVKSLIDHRLRVIRQSGQPAGAISSSGPPKPKLLDQVRQAIRTRHYSYRTEKAYVGWTKRFIFFHNKRHPAAWLMATLLYGAGLRLMECMRLRVKDVDFGSNQIVVRGGKGNKDRLTMFPTSVKEALRRHLEWVRKQYQRDVESGYGGVSLPYALERKYPNAAREWGWQWVFPASKLYVDRQEPTCSRMAMTFGRFRNSWGTRT